MLHDYANASSELQKYVWESAAELQRQTLDWGVRSLRAARKPECWSSQCRAGGQRMTEAWVANLEEFSVLAAQNQNDHSRRMRQAVQLLQGDAPCSTTTQGAMLLWEDCQASLRTNTLALMRSTGRVWTVWRNALFADPESLAPEATT